MNDDSAQAPSPAHLAELLPQFGIDSFIAQGGMGAVYKGRQLSLDRDVAIKVLLNEFGENTDFRESFISEAKAMARLSHSNLLGVFDYGNVEGIPYIVMEYVDGGSLHEAAWDQAIEPIQAAEIVNGICDGLAHAHQHGIVHRDIKPSNILLTTDVEPKVADFGLAHITEADQPGLFMGTPGYTAPEVFEDPDQAGHLADIYSVGVILHQLLTGINPAGSEGPPTQATGDLRLDAIWRKATHITPSQRYNTIAALASDLKKWSTAMQKLRTPSVAAPRRPSYQPVQTNTGGGVFGKLVIIGIIVAAGVFSYQYLQNKKQVTKKDSAESGKALDTNLKPNPELDTDLDTSLKPTVQDEPSPLPDLTSVKDSGSDEPDIEPVLDTEPKENLPPGDPELRERAISLILDSREKRDKELAANARALLFRLDSYARDTKKTEVTFIERLKGDVIDNRIPLTDGVIGLPATLASDFEQARSKEAAIDAACLSGLTVIRDAYVPRLEKAAEETIDVQLKQRLLAQAERAEDLDAWIELLAPEPTWVPKKSVGSFSAGDFVGNWDQHSEGKVSRWIAHAGGRMEVVGKDWDQITWKILDDGTLEVDWNKVRPYVFKRRGDGWTDLTTFGQETTLTRGDW